MFHMSIWPRSYETDAFGHINNTVITGWFEAAREPIFRIFSPQMDLRSIPAILARVEVDFLAQVVLSSEVTLETVVGRLGNASFHVHQAAWQDGHNAARGKAVLVAFDYASQKPVRLADHFRGQLVAHQQALTPG